MEVCQIAAVYILLIHHRLAPQRFRKSMELKIHVIQIELICTPQRSEVMYSLVSPRIASYHRGVSYQA